MKKLLLPTLSFLVVSLFVLAQEPTTTPTTTPTRGRQVDLNCTKNAVEKREDALKTARETYFNKVSQAYNERKTGLLNAWTIQTHKERQKKIQEAWNNFRKNIIQAKEEYKKENNQIWKTFVQDRQNCKSGPTGENPGIDLSY
jgi:hypothetical protein